MCNMYPSQFYHYGFASYTYWGKECILLYYIGRYLWYWLIDHSTWLVTCCKSRRSSHNYSEKINSHCSDGWRFRITFEEKCARVIVMKKIAPAHGGDINSICSSLSPLDGPLASECYQKKIRQLFQHWKFLQISEKLFGTKSFLFIFLANQIIMKSSQSWSDWSGWRTSRTTLVYPDYFQNICMRFVWIYVVVHWCTYVT